MDKGTIQRIVQQYRSPYTACGWAFVRALRLQPRPPLRHAHRRHPNPTRGEVLECMRQDHGVDL